MGNEYIVLDLEMTGLNPRTDAILEIGAVKYRKGRETERFERLVCPRRKIEKRVQEITGITDEMADSGEELDSVMGEFLEFLEEDVIVGHNVIFDYSFLKQWAVNHKIPFEKKAVDTLKIARKCLPHLEKRSLDYLCEYFEISREESHRAYHDAKATAKLYDILQKEFMATEPELFVPKALQYKAKKQTPATARQKNNLMELAEYHRIELERSVDNMTRSEASRLTDQLITRFGRLMH